MIQESYCERRRCVRGSRKSSRKLQPHSRRLWRSMKTILGSLSSFMVRATWKRWLRWMREHRHLGQRHLTAYRHGRRLRVHLNRRKQPLLPPSLASQPDHRHLRAIMAPPSLLAKLLHYPMPIQLASRSQLPLRLSYIRFRSHLREYQLECL